MECPICNKKLKEHKKILKCTNAYCMICKNGIKISKTNDIPEPKPNYMQEYYAKVRIENKKNKYKK